LEAQDRITVDQLVQFLRSSLAQNADERKVLDYIKRVQLTERLTPETVESLSSQGAGPKVMRALQALEAQSAALKPPGEDLHKASPSTGEPLASTELREKSTDTAQNQGPPPPDSATQEKMLDDMREYAENYTSNLPNFMCLQVTRRYIQQGAADIWHTEDTIATKLSYNDHREKYEVISVNGQMKDVPMDKLGGATSTGEFGSLMSGIFRASSQALFNWQYWRKIRGRTVAVFNYSIDQPQSGYSLTWMQGTPDKQEIVTAYKGLVYWDPKAGQMVRVTVEAIYLPESFPIKEASTRLDYDSVDISGSQYMCPLTAVVQSRAGLERSKNEVSFRLYKKFDVGSVITFEGADDPPSPSAPAKPPR
jgi:hypothetical protein